MANAVASKAAYVEISEAGICFVVVPSIIRIASASSMVIDDVDLAEPSSKFNSAAVEPTVVPPIESASVSNVPSKSPSTASILPLNIVALTVPVLGL